MATWNLLLFSQSASLAAWNCSDIVRRIETQSFWIVEASQSVINVSCFFFFLLQLITPKFPVVVKVGHANGGYGKVRISILMNFASLQLIFLKLINREEMRGSWSLDKHHEVSCQKYATARSIFNYLLGIWKSNQTRAFADNRRPLSF